MIATGLGGKAAAAARPGSSIRRNPVAQRRGRAGEAPGRIRRKALFLAPDAVDHDPHADYPSLRARISNRYRRLRRAAHAIVRTKPRADTLSGRVLFSGHLLC